MNEVFNFLENVFLRVPYYSFEEYGPDKLPQVLDAPAFRDAICLASPDFFLELEKKGFAYGKLSERERYTLLKYYNRMSFRPTPFGAFASFGKVAWSAGKGTVLGPALLHLLPSGTWLAGYRAFLKKRGHDLPLKTSPVCYQLGGEIRYAKYNRAASGKLQFALGALPLEALNTVLLEMAEKPVNRSELVAMVMELTGCTRAEASVYVGFLVEEQALLEVTEGSLLFPAGLPPEALPAADAFDRGLEAFWQQATGMPFGSAELMPGQAARLADLGAAQGIPVSGTAFYAGLERNAKGGPDRAVREALSGAVGFLRRVLKVFPPGDLTRFTGDFTAKFDRRQVPLLQALDPDSGITYGGSGLEPVPSALLKGLVFPPRDKTEKGIDWTAAHRLVFRKWFSEQGRGTFDPVVLSDADCYGVPELPGLPLPPTMPVMFRNTVDGPEIESIGAVSGTTLAGRFSVFSEQAYGLAKEIARLETAANPGVLFAELHQLSHDHVDNINRRLPLYEGLIEINGFAGTTGMEQVALNDLVLSVRDGELILESVSRGRRIVPRLPTAYNFRHNNLGVFRLLCDLQFQGLQVNLSLDPSKLFPGLDFYPRLQYGQVILSPARWLLSEAEVTGLNTGARSLGKLHLFRERRGIPRRVSAGEGDRQLAFDLRNDPEALFFLDFLKEYKKLTLQEYLLPAGDVTGEARKTFAGQYIAFLVSPQPVYPERNTPSRLPQAADERRFLPGSEWLYLKVYCTTQSADLLLVTVRKVLHLFPDAATCWFFVRYRDPAPHLRIRVRCGTDAAPALLRAFSKAFSGDPLTAVVREVSSDTYEREVERYTPALIPDVEALFHAGSELALDLPAVLPGTSVGSDGLEALRIVYRMAEAFFPGHQDLLSFLESRRDLFLREFHSDKTFRIVLNDRFREQGPAIRRHLELHDGEGEDAIDGSVFENMFFHRLAGLAAATMDWTAGARTAFLADLVHMQVNRMFAGQQREHELVLYFFLHKYQMSVNARLKLHAGE